MVLKRGPRALVPGWREAENRVAFVGAALFVVRMSRSWRRRRLQRASHGEADAKSSIDRPGHTEAAREVEAFRMGIANHVQKAGRPRTSHVGNVVDESPSDAMLPEVRLDEQGVQLRTAVGARHHSGKAGDDAVAFCDEDAARRNLLDRQRDRVGVCEKRVAIPGVAERRTPLQRLEHRLLIGPCRADGDVLRHWTDVCAAMET